MKQKKSSNMSRSSVILLFLMLIIGSIVAYGVYAFLNTQKTNIYLFKEAYSAGTLVQPGMVVQQEIDTNTFNALAKTGGVSYATANEIQSYIANSDKILSDVVPMQPVLTNCFVSSGGTNVESNLGEGNVAVEVPAESVSGLSGKEVRVGSRVNISSGYALSSSKETDLLFQNVLILDVVKDTEGALKSVYVELSAADSIVLQHALTFEKVSLAILKPGDDPTITDNTTYRKVYSDNSEETTDGMTGLNEGQEPYTAEEVAQ